MEGKVSKLLAIDHSAIPEELLQFQVDSEAVDAKLQVWRE